MIRSKSVQVIRDESIVIIDSGEDSDELNQARASMPYGEILRRYEDEKSKRNRTDLEALKRVAEEYQTLMEYVYNGNRDNLLEQRKGLVQARYAAIDRLGAIRKELGHEELGQLDDESIEESLAIAETMPFFATQAIAGYHDHLLYVGEEVKWLDSDPNTEVWDDLKDRYNGTLNNHEEINASLELAKSYFKAKEMKRDVLSNIMNEEATDNAVRSIGKEIIAAAMESLVIEVARDVRQAAHIVKAELEIVALKAVSGLLKPNRGLAAIITGQSRIFIGAMDNMCLMSYHKRALRDPSTNNIVSYSLDSSQVVLRSGYVFRPAAALLKPLNLTQANIAAWFPNFETLDKLSKRNIDCLGIDQPRREPLLEFERLHWQGIAVSPAGSPNEFISPPNTFGITTALKLFPDENPLAKMSYLLTGSHKGFISVYAVPWSNQEAPKHIGISAALPRNEIAKVVDLRVAEVNPMDQIISLYDNGHIRIWSLNSSAKPRKTMLSFFSLFSSSVSKTVAPITCKYHFAPQAMNIPDQMQHSSWTDFMTSIRMPTSKPTRSTVDVVELARNVAAPQPNMLPTAVCFHPSINLLDKHCALMVGSEGGDILKINYDFAIREFQSPIKYLPPFVGMEYVIPGTVHEDVVIATANKAALGNKVFRELFHFHKAKIIFLGVVSVNSDTIVSIDSASVLAMWKYDRPYFEGNCWFVPQYSAQLDLRVKYYEPTSPSVLISYSELEQDKSVVNSLVLRKRYRSMDGRIAEVLYPSIYQRNFMEFRCRYAENVYQDAVFRVNAPPADEGDQDDIASSTGGLSSTHYSQDSNYLQQSKSITGSSTGSGSTAGTYSLSDTTQPGTYKPHTPEELMAELAAVREMVYSDPNTTWSKQVIREVAVEPQILKVQMSNDGTEIFFLLMYVAPLGFDLEPDELVSSQNRPQMTTVGQRGKFISVATYNVVDRFFSPVRPKFQVGATDEILSFSVGPIIAETLTRHAFIQVNGVVRVISLTTGSEVVSKSLPFALPPTNASLPMVLSTLCPSQRVICFAGPGDPRISIRRIEHILDGSEKGPAILTNEVTQGFIHGVDALQALAVRSVLTPNLVKGQSEDVTAVPREVFLKQLVFYIIDEVVLPAVYEKVDDLIEKRARLRRLEEIYGSTEKLGVVKPNEWNTEHIPPLNVAESEEIATGRPPVQSGDLDTGTNDFAVTTSTTLVYDNDGHDNKTTIATDAMNDSGRDIVEQGSFDPDDSDDEASSQQQADMRFGFDEIEAPTETIGMQPKPPAESKPPSPLISRPSKLVSQ